MTQTNKRYELKDEEIALYAKAMGHPARIAILRFLASRQSCFFGDINDELPITKATVSKHLSELKEVGLIQGDIQPPKVSYCINREKWAEVQGLMARFFLDITMKGEGCCE